MLLAAGSVRAAWSQPAWSCRRPVAVTWDAEHASGRELASVEFYTDGRGKPDASDVRIATEDGRLVLSRLLQVGPGDRVRMLFALQKGVRDYDLFFGNPAATPVDQTLPITAGLLMSMRAWNHRNIYDAESAARSFEESKPELGQVMIPDLFLGFNPINDRSDTISKISGTLFTPFAGPYEFAMTVDHFGALYIDGRPLLFATPGPPDIRFHATTTLSRGSHEIVFYHVSTNVDAGRFTVGWQSPGSPGVQVIGRQAFGTCFGAQAGALQVRDKTINADFVSTYVGLVEIGVDNAYSLHFKCPMHGVSRTVYQWNFGDGQTATGEDVDHVYFQPGVYPVSLTTKIGENTDKETRKLVVGPDYQHPLNPPVVDAKAAAVSVAVYDPSTLPADALGEAAKLLLQAGLLDRASEFATAAMRHKHHVDAHAVVEAVSTISDAFVAADQIQRACVVWSAAPADSDVQPRAAKRAAQLAMWGLGDFDRAATLLRPLVNRNDPSIKRMYGQALLLVGNVGEATKILQQLPPQDSVEKEAVLSGAFARSIDFYIRRNEPDAGDEAWERWQAKYPATFLTGYAAVLRAQLIALHGQPSIGAKVAAAFATAEPTSSYAPRLLDMAAKWYAPTDPARSNELRDRLRKNYPEDPLAQP